MKYLQNVHNLCTEWRDDIESSPEIMKGHHVRWKYISGIYILWYFMSHCNCYTCVNKKILQMRFCYILKWVTGVMSKWGFVCMWFWLKKIKRKKCVCVFQVGFFFPFTVCGMCVLMNGCHITKNMLSDFDIPVMNHVGKHSNSL